MITIKYIDDKKMRRIQVEGRTLQDAMDWLKANRPDLKFFTISIINKRRA